MIKKVVKTLEAVFVSLLLCNTLYTSDITNLRALDIFEDIGMQEMEDEMAIDPDFLESIDFDQMMSNATRALPVSEILPVLAPIQSEICSIISEPFYKKTHPLAARSLLDLPIFEIHLGNWYHDWIVGVNLFFNHTDRMVFACNSTNIDSYLDLKNQTVINAIKTALPEILPTLEELFSKDVVRFLEELLGGAAFQSTIRLFENFTVQQRRAGFMFHAIKQWPELQIRTMLPFYYLERNIFARPEEQAAIEKQFGAGTEEEQEQFQQNHAISDQIGFGDFRFEGMYHVFEWDNFDFYAGIELTLPTAFAVFKGIKGKVFDDNLCQPKLELENFLASIPMDAITSGEFDPALIQEAKEILIGDLCKNKNGFLLSAVDRLNAIVLDQKLGNNGHAGLGVVFRGRTLMSAFLDEYDWAYNLSFNPRLSFQYYTPSTETRFFACRQDKAVCDALDFESTEQAEANFRFIQDELVEKFFPYALCARIQPGPSVRWLNRVCYSGEFWEFNIGTDFWIQGREKIKSIRANQKLVDCLDVCNAIKPFTGQSKIYLGLGMKRIREDHTILFSINAEGTWWSEAIGSDYTATLLLEANF